MEKENLRSEIQECMALMKEYGVSKLVLEKEGIEIERVISQSVPAAILPQATPADSVTEVVPQVKKLNSVDSPMVGTFYSAKSPESPPYVAVGDRIESGQVIGIVEAMKVMNEIKSDKAGVITRLLVENGTPVDFGCPLFELEG